VPWCPAGFGTEPAAVGHRVRHGTSGTDAPGLGAEACYADDTLVLVWGSTWGRTVRLAELAVACAVAAIKGLGLVAYPDKSEAMWFCWKADYGTPPVDYRLRLVGAEVGVGTSMRYLA
jgi:hypothetical protein